MSIKKWLIYVSLATLLTSSFIYLYAKLAEQQLREAISIIEALKIPIAKYKIEHNTWPKERDLLGVYNNIQHSDFIDNIFIQKNDKTFSIGVRFSNSANFFIKNKHIFFESSIDDVGTHWHCATDKIKLYIVPCSCKKYM